MYRSCVSTEVVENNSAVYGTAKRAHEQYYS